MSRCLCLIRPLIMIAFFKAKNFFWLFLVFESHYSMDQHNAKQYLHITCMNMLSKCSTLQRDVYSLLYFVIHYEFRTDLDQLQDISPEQLHLPWLVYQLPDHLLQSMFSFSPKTSRYIMCLIIHQVVISRVGWNVTI